MAQRISDLVPDAGTLLSLEPEELAGVVLQVVNALPRQGGRMTQGPRLNEFVLSQSATYPEEEQWEIRKALVEAWTWLEREGIIAPEAPQPGVNVHGGWDRVIVTRKGKRLKQASDVEAYRAASGFPRHLFSPLLVQKVWPLFVRGDYETAVFQAFREVEIAVRNSGGFSAEDYGVALMRSAFDPLKGPLADMNSPPPEREAVAHLFAGAIGAYKNPSSHRHVDMDDAPEAFEAILFANHLLRIVGRAKPTS